MVRTPPRKPPRCRHRGEERRLRRHPLKRWMQRRGSASRTAPFDLLHQYFGTYRAYDRYWLLPLRWAAAVPAHLPRAEAKKPWSFYLYSCCTLRPELLKRDGRCMRTIPSGLPFSMKESSERSLKISPASQVRSKPLLQQPYRDTMRRKIETAKVHEDWRMWPVVEAA